MVTERSYIPTTLKLEGSSGQGVEELLHWVAIKEVYHGQDN